MAKVALVTGANRGIGLELAMGLAARGCTVLAGARDPSRMPPKTGLETFSLDVTLEASCRAAVEMVRDRHGRLDLLVNNAAILLDGSATIFDVGSDILRPTFETNVLGPLRLAQACLALIPRGGRIINVSSGGGQLSNPSTWSPAYCASKTALNAITVQLAKALEGRGIAVNSVCPGWVRTDMGGSAAPRSVQEGAAGILWLALDAPQTLSGGFFRDREPIPW